LLVPAFKPFTFHWYEGVDPPFAGVAENVTGVAPQTGLVEAKIETLTGKLALTVMVTILEVAGLPVAQTALEVRTTSTWSLLAGL
jgi:hypothetical protein